MDLIKIKKQLDKINRTIAFFSEEVEMTRVEKDLLLEYVKALFDMINKEEVAVIEVPEIPEAIHIENHHNEIVQQEEVQQVPPPQEPAPAAISDELQELFAWTEAKELSDKLRRSPIGDLTKAFSINDKILTINELFDGNTEEFTVVLEKVNALSTYEEAVNYLASDIAEKYQWGDAQMKKKALRFIHKIQQRFI